MKTGHGSMNEAQNNSLKIDGQRHVVSDARLGDELG